MQGRLENQIKAEKKIEKLLEDLPKEVTEFYINFSSDSEFRSCLQYIYKIKRFLVWYCDSNKIEMEDIDFTSITDTEIAEYLKYSETKETSKGKEYTSFSYRKQIWSALNSFFDFLYKKRKITNNPVELIKRPSKDDKVEHVHLSKKDLDKMIKVIQKDIGLTGVKSDRERWKMRDLAILYTFIFTGMRESALCEIDINKIDFGTDTIEVIDKEHKVNTYTIAPKLKNVLIAWLEDRKILLGDKENDALFISSKYSRINQDTVRLMIRKYSKEALGYSVSPHRLRAAYGNLIYQQTRDIELMSRGMKHASISTTRLYVESDENKINKQVADILSGIF